MILNLLFLAYFYCALSLSYFELDNYEGSLEALKKAIEIIEDNCRHFDHLPEAYDYLGKIYFLTRRNELAYQMSKKSIDLKTSLFDVRSGINRQLLKVNDECKEYKIQEGKCILSIDLVLTPQLTEVLTPLMLEADPPVLFS